MADAFLGLPYVRIAELVAPVAGGRCPDSSDFLAAIFARGALTTLIEPGDTDAHRLVAALGPATALVAIVEGWDAGGILAFAAGEEDAVSRSRGRAHAASSDTGPAASEQREGRASIVPRAAGRGSHSTGPGGTRASAHEHVGDDLRGFADPASADPASADPASASAASASATPAARRLTDALTRWRSRLSLATAVRACESATHLHAALVTPEMTAWPESLVALDAGEPPARWVRGDVSRLGALDRSVSLVGARAATGYGEHVAMESAAGLGARGFAIVSGGAYGIDGAAHRAALAAGHPTFAFLAGGVDRLYPAGHADLLRRIADTGALIGELPCGSTPTRWRFLMRNRLIAAVGSATVVVEAGHRSGSLNTAGHAAEMGRPLGAVPGPVTSPASAGCHRLIREYNAVCVTTVDEMAELADPLGGAATVHQPVPGSGEPVHLDDAGGGTDARVHAQISAGRGIETEALAGRVGVGVSTLLASLGRLEAAGAIREDHDGWRTARISR